MMIQSLGSAAEDCQTFGLNRGLAILSLRRACCSLQTSSLASASLFFKTSIYAIKQLGISYNNNQFMDSSRLEKQDQINLLIQSHIQTFFYSNISFFTRRAFYADLKDFSYVHAMDPKKGGNCFQSTIYFSRYLKKLDVQFQFWLSNVVMNRQIDPLQPPDHLVIIANILGKRLLTDVAFGNNSPRCTIALPDESEQTVVVKDFQLSINKEKQLQLSLCELGNRLKLYIIRHPIKEQQLVHHFKCFFNSPFPYLIRDRFIKVSLITPTSRTLMLIDSKSKTCSFQRKGQLDSKQALDSAKALQRVRCCFSEEVEKDLAQLLSLLEIK